MIEPYDFNKFRVERMVSDDTWREIPAATFTYAANVDPDANGTLVYGAETGTISVVRFGVNLSPPFNPGNRVRARYYESVVLDGYVDTVKIYRTAGPGTRPRDFRFEFTCTFVGKYALAMSKTVCYPDLPTESAYKRLTRFVTITNLLFATEAESESEVTNG
jgi:hypothetical protein